jgi:hypothetical protein
MLGGPLGLGAGKLAALGQVRDGAADRVPGFQLRQSTGPTDTAHGLRIGATLELLKGLGALDLPIQAAHFGLQGIEAGRLVAIEVPLGALCTGNETLHFCNATGALFAKLLNSHVVLSLSKTGMIENAFLDQIRSDLCETNDVEGLERTTDMLLDCCKVVHGPDDVAMCLAFDGADNCQHLVIALAAMRDDLALKAIEEVIAQLFDGMTDREAGID